MNEQRAVIWLTIKLSPFQSPVKLWVLFAIHPALRFNEFSLVPEMKGTQFPAPAWSELREME